ncbi:hypothetical protein AVEN_118189-1 [Araneus ventricosus]|uniref:Uncharacterized protein n=1 Tax=Araneus ventricosus TaxID=182803 RepID=A0A4Y2JX69_ARAVE|nr:hypothetical protein AVEN_118189-1 [Araneus ventricosus]
MGKWNFLWESEKESEEKKKKKMVNLGVPTEVPYHPFNYRMAAAIFIRVVSKHGKVSMRYWMKPLTAPPGENGGVSVSISKTLWNLWFQHVGEPEHKTSSVKQYLVENFGEQIIVYGGFQE